MAYKIVNRWNTECSACGGNAKPSEAAHIHGGPRSGYSEDSHLGQTNGCGAAFDEPAQSPYGDDVSRFDIN